MNCRVTSVTQPFLGAVGKMVVSNNKNLVIRLKVIITNT